MVLQEMLQNLPQLRGMGQSGPLVAPVSPSAMASLIVLEALPSLALLYLMVIAQGFFDYALPSVMGAIVNEIFEGPHYGSIFGTLSVALIGGGAAGPWVTGVLHDATGSYRAAFLLAILCCAISAAAIWLAAPRKVRLVPGRRQHR